MNIFKSNLYFALLIYPGIESYDILQIILAPLIAELFQFYFWEDQSTKTWLITILSENNKLKVLKDFDLNVIFTPERATKIKELWNSFNNLYNDIHKLNIFGNQFQQKAYQWLKLFLTKSQGNINSSGFVCGLY
ncbi:9512_t:CDS:2 [Scutellospora calospora]|uniref:9512_t:CDS:1 n=1 Tax=Scutellospora calospora TaxID=85575 RepID=A0ACA9JUB7_9GLOM|nr:9512_t:CDS:2 [Scutellospora calospora]